MIDDRDLDEVKEELKRADHLIYVSLKYTRTVDVILSVIARLINAQELIIDKILVYLEKKKKLKNLDYNKPFRIKTDWIKKALKKDKTLNEFLEFYELLTKIMKVEHIKRGEFRKNLTLIAQDKDGKLVAEVMVETLKEYYKKAESLIKEIEEMIK